MNFIVILRLIIDTIQHYGISDEANERMPVDDGFHVMFFAKGAASFISTFLIQTRKKNVDRRNTGSGWRTVRKNREREKNRGENEKTAAGRKEGRGLDSSCTVNNTPLGRDRLAHPHYPVTIYLLFVPHFRFVATVAIGRECFPSWKRENLPVHCLSPPDSSYFLDIHEISELICLGSPKGSTRLHLSETTEPDCSAMAANSDSRRFCQLNYVLIKRSVNSKFYSIEELYLFVALSQLTRA